jgi:hypothetical protein
MLSWDEPGGNLFTGLAVSGMKVARVRSGLHNGTGELLGTKRSLAGLRRAARGRTASGENCERQSTGCVPGGRNVS